MNMGVFPSGQWGQTVNLLLSASVVRIHPRPPRTPVSNGYRSFCFICLEKGDARVDSNSIDPPNSPAGKKAPAGLFRCAARVIHPRPPRTPVSNGYRSFCFICLEKGDARVDSNSSGADRRLRRKQGGEAGAALRFFEALPRGCGKSGKRNS